MCVWSFIKKKKFFKGVEYTSCQSILLPFLVLNLLSLLFLHFAYVSFLLHHCIYLLHPLTTYIRYTLKWIKCLILSSTLSVPSLLLLLLSRFSRVRLCATPQTAAHQVPPSLGFSRQEHWSGLPFPSPMHESEKWKWSRSVVSDS